jgi:hypothetical protein
MSRIPTVDELVEAALEGADSYSGDSSVEKTASTEIHEYVDMMEKTARELEEWAAEAEGAQVEAEKVASQEKKADRHDRILKLAMAGTILNALNSLDENGQLEAVMEKSGVARWGVGRLGTKFRRGGASKIQQRFSAQAKQDPFRGAIARTGEEIARVGGGVPARESALRSAKGRMKVQMQKQISAEKAQTAAAKAKTRASEKATKETAEAAKETKKKYKLIAGGAGAAGLAGAGLAYQAGAGKERERQRERARRSFGYRR